MCAVCVGCVWSVRVVGVFSLVELELETLEESLPGEGVSIRGGSFCPSPSESASPRPVTAPSSQPFRLPKVIRAFRMW